MPTHPTPTSPSPPTPRAVRVGVFDSGVGGLSVLRAIRTALPGADLLYVADAGHAPYGDRSEAYVLERSVRIADFLIAEGCDVIVVACNTATAAAVAALRARHPHLPLVGVEPGIKPALATSPTHRVGVLATTRTLASEKFRKLAETHAASGQLILQPCPGFADAVERAADDEAGLAACVERYAAPLRAANVDTVVLGCTHYAFAMDLLAAALPGVRIVDTADAVARQTARLATGSAAAHVDASPSTHGTTRLWTTGDAQGLRRFLARWWPAATEVEARPDL